MEGKKVIVLPVFRERLGMAALERTCKSSMLVNKAAVRVDLADMWEVTKLIK
jgi:hypothetical protein